MRLKPTTLFAAAALTMWSTAQPVTGQTPHQGPSHPVQSSAAGPHGGSLRQAEGVQVETLVTQAGIQLFVYDSSGSPAAVEAGRGAVSMRVDGSAKRYRYDLLPDGKGALTAPVNLAKIAGRQIDLEIQLVGVSAANSRVSYHEIASVPQSEAQLAADAIARQKICPVSGKLLGSMGEPVTVDVAGQRIYVCCAGCSDAVKSNPEKYAGGRPPITISTATVADAALMKRQGNCPVMDEPLGNMGTPIKVMVGDKPIFLCCKGCIKKVQAEPAKYLAMVYGDSDAQGAIVPAASPAVAAAADRTSTAIVPAGVEQVREGVFKVTDADAPFIAKQQRCPVMDEPLDAMGGPFKVVAAGRAIYICCPGCAKSIAKEPQKYIELLAEQGVDAPMLR